MSRMETTALAELVESANGAGFTLPAELLDAYHAYTRVKDIALPAAEVLHPEDAAARLVAAVTAGESPDLASLAAEVDQTQTRERVGNHAQNILTLAREQAISKAASTAGSLADVVITDHLRPAFDALHEQAREVADELADYGTDPAALLKAPTKARNAYLRLPDLVERRQAIFTARRWVNSLGHWKPQHDEQGIFGEFRHPTAFFPDWKPPMRMPFLPAPEDPALRLLWVVSPAAEAAGLWLPTMAEQDDAWLAVFGPELERAKTNRQNLDGFKAVFGQ